MKPMFFNTEMAKAILEGRKTVTRRLVKGYALEHLITDTDGSVTGIYHQDEGCVVPISAFAPCNPGDVLYVRETFDKIPVSPGGHFRFNERYYYKADGDLRPETWRGKWRPSIHMPKEAARLFLRVKSVRVERLQDITIPQIVAEGAWEDCIECLSCYSSAGIQCCIGGEDECSVADSAFEEWRNLWNGTIKTADLPKYGWEANPWVWVIEFERCEKPEAMP